MGEQPSEVVPQHTVDPAVNFEPQDSSQDVLDAAGSDRVPASIDEQPSDVVQQNATEPAVNFESQGPSQDVFDAAVSSLQQDSQLDASEAAVSARQQDMPTDAQAASQDASDAAVVNSAVALMSSGVADHSESQTLAPV